MNGMKTNGSRITPLAVASGAIASFDAQVAAPLKILKADINPVQAGSGDPSPENIRPISGWDEIKITNESGEIFEAANIVATESEIKAYYDADLVLKAGTYVFSTDATDSVTLIGAQYYSGSWVNLFTQIGTSRKFTLSRSGKCHFRAELRGSGDLSSNTVSLKQLDERTIELPDTVYGGKLDMLRGRGSNDCVRVRIKDLNWTYQSAQTRFYTTSLTDLIKRPAVTEIPTNFMCECYRPSGFSGYLNGDIAVATSGNVFVKDSNYTDVNDWLADIGDYYIVYPLVIPNALTTNPISMDAYAGSNKIATDSGNTTACYLKGVTS